MWYFCGLYSGYSQTESSPGRPLAPPGNGIIFTKILPFFLFCIEKHKLFIVTEYRRECPRACSWEQSENFQTKGKPNMLIASFIFIPFLFFCSGWMLNSCLRYREAYFTMKRLYDEGRISANGEPNPFSLKYLKREAVFALIIALFDIGVAYFWLYRLAFVYS